jgi:hypothetical protein
VMERVPWVKAPGPEEVAEPAIPRACPMIRTSSPAPRMVAELAPAPVVERVWAGEWVVLAEALEAGVAGATEEACNRGYAEDPA